MQIKEDTFYKKEIVKKGVKTNCEPAKYEFYSMDYSGVYFKREDNRYIKVSHNNFNDLIQEGYFDGKKITEDCLLIKEGESLLLIPVTNQVAEKLLSKGEKKRRRFIEGGIYESKAGDIVYLGKRKCLLGVYDIEDKNFLSYMTNLGEGDTFYSEEKKESFHANKQKLKLGREIGFFKEFRNNFILCSRQKKLYHRFNIRVFSTEKITDNFKNKIFDFIKTIDFEEIQQRKGFFI